MEFQRPYRSLFWPIVLIGVGVIWLLSNMNVIQPVSWALLLRMWPVLLIVAGLDLMFGRLSPLVGIVIGILAVAFVIVVLVAGQSLGIASSPEVVRQQFVEPIGTATSAQVVLDLSSPRTTISALSDNTNLIDATIDHFGDVSLTSSGGQNRTLTLRTNGGSINWFDAIGQPMHWDIGLTPAIPLELNIDSSSGGGDFDLEGLMLNRLDVDSGSGSIDISLPEGDASYPVRINSGSGRVEVDVPCSSIELRMDAGSGSVLVNVPGNCPLRVEVINGGSGSVRVPGGLDQVSGDDDEGVWESSDYAGAAERVLIIMEDQGSGSFQVR